MSHNLSCKKCDSKENLTVLGLCEQCADKFFKGGTGTGSLAKLLGIGSNRLLKYEKSGELVPERKQYNTRVYRRKDVERLLRTRRIQGVHQYRIFLDEHDDKLPDDK
ncbi:MAG: MerR family transcriptional regulator [Candidatus Saccharimonadales bacterium]